MEAYNYWSQDTSESIEHHGIKGQKWGVRRYQNEDGSWTTAGLYRRGIQSRLRSAKKTKAQTDEIFNTLSPHKKELLGSEKDAKEMWGIDDSELILKRYIQKCGKIPVSVLDIVSTYYLGGQDHTGKAFVVLATREGYEGKGYASKNVEKALKWVNNHKKLVKELNWTYNTTNLTSKHLAEKYGFTIDLNRTWVADLATYEVGVKKLSP